MDIITEVLNTIRFNGNIFIHSNFSGHWGANFTQVNLPVFHCVLQGSCFIKSEYDENHFEMHAGDVCFLPNGVAHSISSSPKIKGMKRVIEPGKICIKTDIPDEQSETRLLCGVFQSDMDFQHPIFNTLPNIMHVAFSKDENTEASWSQHAVYAIENALRYQSAGMEVLVDRLYEILFVQILQKFFFDTSFDNCFYSSYRSPRINLVLIAIHFDPASEWTLDKMATMTHMSRSAFTSNFRKIVGMSPMAYLTSWRMLKAHSLVKTTGLPLSIIAHKVGFRTQSGLNKAFKKYFNISPKKLRM